MLAAADAAKNTLGRCMQSIVCCVLFSCLSPFVLVWCDCARSLPRHIYIYIYIWQCEKSNITVLQSTEYTNEWHRINERRRENRTQTHPRCTRCAIGIWKWRWFVCILPSAISTCVCVLLLLQQRWLGKTHSNRKEAYVQVQSHRFRLCVCTKVSSQRFRHSVQFLSKLITILCDALGMQAIRRVVFFLRCCAARR